MVLRSSLVVMIGVLAACGRPPLSEATLRVSVIRTGTNIDHVWVALEDERSPCGRLDATVTLNGVPLRTQTDGTLDRGSYLFIPTPGCLPPSFELEAGGDARLANQPFELVIDAGGERVVLRSDALLTSRFVGPTEVVAGDALRLVPDGDFSWARFNLDLAVSHPSLARADTDSPDVAAQKRAWSSWPTETRENAVVATVPATLPPGEYGWHLGGTSASVRVERCEGVAACNVRLSLDEVGKVTVR